VKTARFLRDPKFYLGLFVSLFFLFLAFYDVNLRPFSVQAKIDFGEMWHSITHVDPLLILIVMAQVVFMLFVRGHRWSLFLKPVKRLPWIPLGWSTCIGFAVNNLLPARLGEVARSISASRKSGLGFGTVFGTVVVERIYDTLTILILFVFSLYVLEFSEPIAKISQAAHAEFGVAITQQSLAINLSVLVAIILAAIIMLKWKTELSLHIAGFFFKPLPQRWREKIINGLRNFIGGLTQTTVPWEVAWIVVLSAALWIISAISVWLALLACDLNISFTDSILVLMALVIAVSIPASPGYIGPYHFLAATAISLSTGEPWEKAMGGAIVLHLANYLPQTLFGLFALAREGLSLKEIEEKPVKPASA